MSQHLIVVDTETGGLDAQVHSILSFGAVIYKDGTLFDRFYAPIAEPHICVTSAALEVNGLTLKEIEAGWAPALAVERFKTWLARNGLSGKQTLVAHNVSFDVAFLRRLWRLADAKFEDTWSHRMLCTQSSALLLQQAGKLPECGAGLDAVAAELGLEPRDGPHNALWDAVLTGEVLKELVYRINE